MEDGLPGNPVEFAETVDGGVVGFGDPVEGVAAADDVILRLAGRFVGGGGSGACGGLYRRGLPGCLCRSGRDCR